MVVLIFKHYTGLSTQQIYHAFKDRPPTARRIVMGGSTIPRAANAMPAWGINLVDRTPRPPWLIGRIYAVRHHELVVHHNLTALRDSLPQALHVQGKSLASVPAACYRTSRAACCTLDQVRQTTRCDRELIGGRIANCGLVYAPFTTPASPSSICNNQHHARSLLLLSNAENIPS